MNAVQSFIWILEDEEGARFVYRESLALKYDLRFFETVGALEKTLNEKKDKMPDLLIADLHLPDRSFLHFLAENKKAFEKTPFIVVSSNDDIDILRKCFEDGATDYLTKPFRKSELVVKIQRILETQSEQFRLDAEGHTIQNREGATVHLTQRELQILSLLRDAKGKPVPRDTLIEKIWTDSAVSAKTLDVHLYNLRKKVAVLGLEIEHVPPNGFRTLNW